MLPYQHFVKKKYTSIKIYLYVTNISKKLLLVHNTNIPDSPLSNNFAHIKEIQTDFVIFGVTINDVRTKISRSLKVTTQLC